MPADIFNAPGYAGMPHVPVGEHCTRLTKADFIVSALYQKIVKDGDLSTVNADLKKLGQVMAGSIAHGDVEHEQRASNIYLGKALNILCQLARRRGALAVDERLLSEAAHACAGVVAARQEFTLENVSVIMFHLGELINHAQLQQVCSRTITDHLAPIFEATLRQQPVHAIEGATLAFGLVSALRASEHQLAHPGGGGAVPRPAADRLLLVVPELLAAQPDLLVAWESRTLVLLAKYGVQYLRQLAQLGRRRGRLLQGNGLQLNAARALKPIIEEARRHSRGVWDQRDCTYRGFTPDKQPRDCLAYSAHYYGQWLGQQPEWIKDRFALHEAERGPLADNPHDGRNFAEVVRQGTQPLQEAPAASEFPILTPGPTRRPLSIEIASFESPAELTRFSQAAGELLRLGEGADRIDREEAISATNALIISIDAGRTTLTYSLRVQMLLDMDSVCMRLYAADPLDAPQYAWQLRSMRGFLSSQLALLVGPDGRPLVGTEVPFDAGLSSWQRSLLRVLNERDSGEVSRREGVAGAGLYSQLTHAR